MVKVISIKRGIALTGIILFLSLNACRTCNCPAYTEWKPPPAYPKGEGYYTKAESGIESVMPDNTSYN